MDTNNAVPTENLLTAERIAPVMGMLQLTVIQLEAKVAAQAAEIVMLRDALARASEGATA